MRKAARLILAAMVLMSGTAGSAAQTSLHLYAIIPAYCAIDVTGGSIEGQRLILNVHRTCNTAHQLVLSGASGEAQGKFTLHYNGQLVNMDSNSETITQPERYYNNIDSVVIDAQGASSEDLLRYASTLNIGIETE